MRRRVVRVRLPMSDRTYAYRCKTARIGDIVRVDTPYSGVVHTRVVGYGRRGYPGRLKQARRVHDGR